MRESTKNLFVFLFLLLAHSITSLNAQNMSLSGEDWEIKDIPNDTLSAFCHHWIKATVPGNIRADPTCVPYLFDEDKVVELTFEGTYSSLDKAAVLRIHSSDQSITGAMISIELNSVEFEAELPEGYEFQKTDPAHLAIAGTVEVDIPAGLIREDTNFLKLKVRGGGWFSWDALDLRSVTTME